MEELVELVKEIAALLSWSEYGHVTPREYTQEDYEHFSRVLKAWPLKGRIPSGQRFCFEMEGFKWAGWYQYFRIFLRTMTIGVLGAMGSFIVSFVDQQIMHGTLCPHLKPVIRFLGTINYIPVV